MRKQHGFRSNTRLDDALDVFLDHVSRIERSETVVLEDADARVAASDVEAERNVPGYDRAAMDGYAVRAEDTYGASTESPSSLEVTEGEVEEGEAVAVSTGEEIPKGADAVVMVEDTRQVGGMVEIETGVSRGKNVGNAGEDVAVGDSVVDEGHRLRPSDIAVLRSLGIDEVEVYDKPEVAVIPTGEELVESDPDPGEIIETNGEMVSNYVERWGGRPRYGEIVEDDFDAISEAVVDAADADLVVTTGGSSVGERDLTPEVIDENGEILVHGVGIKPGHPVGLGVVEGTPVVMLPGYPVSCVVNSFLFVRPAVRELGSIDAPPDPTVDCVLDEKINSEVGKRTFTRVSVERRDGEHIGVPTRTSGAGVLSSVSEADAVIETGEENEGYDAGEVIEAVYWEWGC
ncbi:MAG: molybdopterin molybdotransferase MoeA [Halobacteria archaeon]|nr:molybdopterin molybdotransferase MoeA [Halobacteria archaeon]